MRVGDCSSRPFLTWVKYEFNTTLHLIFEKKSFVNLFFSWCGTICIENKYSGARCATRIIYGLKVGVSRRVLHFLCFGISHKGFVKPSCCTWCYKTYLYFLATLEKTSLLKNVLWYSCLNYWKINRELDLWRHQVNNAVKISTLGSLRM